MTDTTDIVERLCHRAKFDTAEDPYRMLEEAAAEIERLRKDVTMAVEALERTGKQSPEHRKLVERVWKGVSR